MVMYKNSKDCRQKEYLLLDQLIQLEKKKKKKSFQTHKPLESVSVFFNYVNCSNKKYYLSPQTLPLFYPSTTAATATLFLAEKKNNCFCIAKKLYRHFPMCFSSKLACSLSYSREFLKYFQKRIIFMIITLSLPFYLLLQKSLLHSLD